MGETNGSHRGIFSMRSTVATPPSLLPRGRTKTARHMAGFLAALMAVVAMALGSAACTELAEAQTDPSTDRVALVALYNATDGPNWSNETNWLSAEPIGEWHGVTTDGSGRVTALDLDENELNGKMPAELGSLSNLQRLYLNDNSGLSGPLPGSSTGLTSLTYLDLSGTGVCAPTDASFQAWLENIATRLGVVNCREQTTGDPLIDRYDTNNNATIERSEVLAAIDDHLFGGADETISRAEVLRLIDLHLFGPPTANATPSGTAASDRAALIAFHNSMDGPNWKNSTNWLSDKPIGDWYGITTDNRGRVIRISLHYNGLNGQIPLQFGELAALETLELNGNDADNPDLSALSDLPQLRFLSLGESGISDLSALMDLPRLTDLYLYTNKISDISPLLSARSLEYLSLYRNPLSGSSVYAHIPVLQERGVTVRHSGYALTGGDVTIEDGPLVYNDNLVVLPVSRGLAFEAYTRSFYKHFEDDFDFLVLVSPDNVPESDPGGYYLPVANDVQGIGLQIFSVSSELGSAGKLKGIPFFSHVWWFRGIILHEVLHQWAAYGSHPMASGGHFTHFSNIFGAFGGVFSSPYEEIVDLGENRFKAERRGWSYTYGPLELYLAGLVPPEDVPDFWVAIDGKWIDQESGTFTATKIEKYTVSDIIAAYGRRVPEASRSQREFRAAVILLIDEKDPTVDSKLLESLSADIAWFSFPGTDESEENNFYEATGGRATLKMDGLAQFLKDSE